MKKKQPKSPSSQPTGLKSKAKSEESELARLRKQLKLEAALERVRSKTMRMKKSSELSTVGNVLLKQMKGLGIQAETTWFWFIDTSKKSLEIWTTHENKLAESVSVDPTDMWTFKKEVAAWKKGEPFFQLTIPKKEAIKSVNKIFGIKLASKREATHFHLLQVRHQYGFLGIGTWEKAGDEVMRIVQRFAKVFEQAYTRFLDLQKAEAQAREAQIEAALERVRARTMAMHSSEDVNKAVVTLFGEIKKLGIEPISCGLNILHQSGDMETWTAKGVGERIVGVSGKLNMIEHPSVKKLFKDWKAKRTESIYQLKGKEVKDFYKIVYSQRDYSTPKVKLPDKLFLNNFLIAEGSLWTFTYYEVAAEHSDVLKRFARVFSLTYKRYKDLQKAEAQAREAQIETALERVRSRTMGMQKSEELGEVIILVFQQFIELGIRLHNANFSVGNVKDWKKKDRTFWVANLGVPHPIKVLIPYVDHRMFNRVIQETKKGSDFFEDTFGFEEKNSYFRHWFDKGIRENRNLAVEKKVFKSPGYARSMALCNDIELAIGKFEPVPFSAEENIILRRFAKVFEQTYTRFLDLQKAEAQTREAQIEAALERVRARTMAMHKSEELREVVALMYEQLSLLDLAKVGCEIILCNEECNQLQFWSSNVEESFLPDCYDISRSAHPFFGKLWKSWKEQTLPLTITMEGKKKKDFDQFIFSKTDFKKFPKHLKKYIRSRNIDVFTFTTMKYGLMEAIDDEPLPEEKLQVLQRFTSVFEQTYTRFLDLQKAEAQAREAQIEAALEKVRSRSMAMHKSDELLDVITVVSEQLQLLNFRFHHVSFANNELDKDYKFWVSARGMPHPMRFNVPYSDIPLISNMRDAQRKGTTLYTDILTKKENRQWHKHLLNHGGTQVFSKEVNEFSMSRGMARSFAINPNIILILANYASVPYSDDENKIITRFGQVFEQSYTRFLDLQKAEAQAREAQIEAALERVRSRSLAMHKSEEIQGVVDTVLSQLSQLQIDMDTAGILIRTEGSRDTTFWLASKEHDYSLSMHLPYVDVGVSKDSYNALDNGLDYFEKVYDKDEKDEWLDAVFEVSDMKYFPEERKKMLYDLVYYGYSVTFSNNTAIQTINYKGQLHSEQHKNILRRMTNVFEQSYIRFIDLQKAEAQARESQIEAALERVRSRSMAMQQSDELNEVLSTMFGELSSLGLALERCVLWTFNMEDRSVRWWAANPEVESGTESFLIPYTDHPTCNEYWKAWKERRTRYLYELSGETKRTWDEYLFNHTELARLPAPVKGAMIAPEKVFLYNTFRDFGVLFPASLEHISEENFDIVERFGKVFNQSYTRFKDIQQAEAREKEAIRQASLDRVRAEIASMRTTSDLERITPLIWKELTILNIPFIRCGVFIMDELQQQLHTFLSTPDGKAIAAFHLPYDAPGRTREILEHWLNKQVYLSHWDESAFNDLGDLLVQKGAIPSKDVYLSTVPKGGIYLHCLPFIQGMLYVGNSIKLNEDDIHLVQFVADAFSTAYARYEDFNKLESAKQQVDKTLLDLKQAQTQLVQSEKMASLGELTAGIAHEIQNPLNFVNNFSEVSTELVDEMKSEIDAGNNEEAREIATDLKENLQKINHHGKRAGDIVKGMLQHSRSSSGQKELTDINALADEYLRLAYHGLRAKDKTFNASMKTEFDDTIEKINVVPQDIGRVILNLITNAFYVVNEKKKQNTEEYDPVVTVSTKKIGSGIEVAVKDNGNGIPAHIKEKIFQPFFTTKPTGQGTGLGLSLSYDIVKAHGGELNVETKEGEGSTFIIQLPILS